jgi:hypothetical protein
MHAAILARRRSHLSIATVPIPTQRATEVTGAQSVAGVQSVLVRVANAIYRRLPLNAIHKRRLAWLAYRVTGSLFEGTPGYEAWRAFLQVLNTRDFVDEGVVSRVFRTFGLAERRPALAQAVMAPLICWSFSSSMFKYLLSWSTMRCPRCDAALPRPA